MSLLRPTEMPQAALLAANESAEIPISTARPMIKRMLLSVCANVRPGPPRSAVETFLTWPPRGRVHRCRTEYVGLSLARFQGRARKPSIVNIYVGQVFLGCSLGGSSLEIVITSPP